MLLMKLRPPPTIMYLTPYLLMEDDMVNDLEVVASIGKAEEEAEQGVQQREGVVCGHFDDAEALTASLEFDVEGYVFRGRRRYGSIWVRGWVALWRGTSGSLGMCPRGSSFGSTSTIRHLYLGLICLSKCFRYAFQRSGVVHSH